MVIVLTGIGRSGTSLLQSILYHHAGIVVYPELQFFRRFLIANSATGTLDNISVLRILEKENPRLRNLKAQVDISRIPSRQYDFESVLALFEMAGKDIVLKDARDIDYLNRIRERTGKKAVVICTIRDLRDVVLSRMRADFSKRWGLLLNLVIMRFQYTSLLKWEGGIKVHVIRYEDFTQGNFDALEGLGLTSVDIRGLNLQRAARVLFSEEELAKHKLKNVQKLDASNHDKWIGQLSPPLLLLIDILFCDYFERFGYRVNHNSRLVRALNQVVKRLFILGHGVYIRISVYRDKKRYRI